MYRLWLTAVVGAACWSLPMLAEENPVSLLNSIRQAVVAQLNQSTNYTCVQTISREYWISLQRPRVHDCEQHVSEEKQRFMHDRLRLDVAVSDEKEIYSWHGEAKFSAESVFDMVGSGSISSGSFVGYLKNIFQNRGAIFVYAGESAIKGRRMQNFTYSVPLADSAFSVRDNHVTTPAAFHGVFSADATDHHLVSLSVIADRIGRTSQICSTETEVMYQEVNISGTLPSFQNLFA